MQEFRCMDGEKTIDMTRQDNLVFQWNVPKQIGHRFSIIYSSDCLRQKKADVNGYDFAASLSMSIMKDGVCHENLQRNRRYKIHFHSTNFKGHPPKS